MSSSDDLPVILVSAVDTAAASAMIVELMSESDSPSQTNGAGVHEADDGEPQESGLVWRLANKYYTASVRLQPCPDQPTRPERPAPCTAVQAHLIYLTEDECSEESAGARRAEAARARLARGAVRLVAARTAAPGPALAAWARAARYELVPLLPAPEPEPEPEPEPAGAARLREALHAHVWPGLQRRAAAPLPLESLDRPAGDSDSSSDGDAWGAWRRAGDAGGAGDGEGEGEAARAERFAAALALLPAARAAAGRAGAGGAGEAGAGEAGGAGDAARRLNAERLIALFCRALEDDLPLFGGAGEDER